MENNTRTQIEFSGRDKEMTTHSSTLALKIPRTEELGVGYYYPWGHKESGTTEQLHFTSLKQVTGEVPRSLPGR